MGTLSPRSLLVTPFCKLCGRVKPSGVATASTLTTDDEFQMNPWVSGEEMISRSRCPDLLENTVRFETIPLPLPPGVALGQQGAEYQVRALYS
jgi:hypothetical protein